MKKTQYLDNFDIIKGFDLFNSHILLDDVFDENTDFTMFITFKHDTKKKTSYGYFSFGNNLNPNFQVHFPPYMKIKNDKIAIQKSSKVDIDDTISSLHQIKQLMLWFTKNGDNYQSDLCNNSRLITDTVTSIHSFRANRILINFDYHIQRIGISPNYYAVDGSEFHKIMFLEKSKGTFFQ